jgi:spore coat protein H
MLHQCNANFMLSCMLTLIERGVAPRSLSNALSLSGALLLSLSACGEKGLQAPAAELGDAGPAPHGPTGDAASAPPEPSEPAPRAIGADVFGDDKVLEVRLTLSEADQVSLELDGDQEVYVPAAAELVTATGAQQLARIGVRHKGAYSLHHCFDEVTGIRSYEGSCARLSYKLKFDEYVLDSRFDGLKRLNLHSSSGDATRMRELMGYRLFRDFGVLAPRTAVAKVYVNGEYEGLFIAVEEVDGRFAKAHFATGGDGNLYKEIWPVAGLDASTALGALQTNEDVGDVSAFLGFAQAIAAAGQTTFGADVERWVDLEHTLRYVAVDRALKNWDGIMAFYSASSPHNFFWYHDVDGGGRFQLIPWDLDNTSWAFDPYMAPEAWVTVAPVPDWNQEPGNCTPRPVWDDSGNTAIVPPRCDRMLDLLAETHFEDFREIAAELLAGPFAAARLVEEVDRLSALLEPIIASDPLLDLSQWRTERDNFKLVLERSRSDFSTFVATGLVQEAN